LGDNQTGLHPLNWPGNDVHYFLRISHETALKEEVPGQVHREMHYKYPKFLVGTLQPRSADRGVSPGERPWSGLRHAQVLAHKIQDLPKSKLQWPPDSHEVIKDMAQQCMLSDPHDRPTFERLVEVLKPLQAAVQATTGSEVPQATQ